MSKSKKNFIKKNDDDLSQIKKKRFIKKEKNTSNKKWLDIDEDHDLLRSYK